MKTYPSDKKRGFALVVTLTLLVLLLILALGMLSLSTVSLRSMNASSPADTARANARMAVVLALGELQRTAGDDRRITADGSIFSGAARPSAVGVWKSWSPQLAKNPNGATPNYNAPKTVTAPDLNANTHGFLRWLVSSATPSDLEKADWAKAGSLADPVDLFALTTDGFQLSGSRVPLKKGGMTTGAFAWAVSQAATKAKLTVSGPEDSQRIANDDLQAQPRPTLELSGFFKQPGGDWNERAAKVISMSQAELDTGLWNGAVSIKGGGDFTTQGFGVLADVVNGGLKTDLNLGFEMSDADFAKDQWGQVKSPFHSTNAPVLPPDSYGIQRPLFKPLTQTGSVAASLVYGPASPQYQFPAAAVPTFNTLRSFYRTPHHMYGGTGNPTIFERAFDHIAVQQPGAGLPSPGLGPKGEKSQTAYRPVMDRVIFLLSAGLGTGDEVRFVMTPLVTLWNPYNVGLEIEGAVAYYWIDSPFLIDWKFYGATGNKVFERSTILADLVGYQFWQQRHGRSVNPYFFCNIMNPGGAPIRFEPGEVRVFAPQAGHLTEYKLDGTVAQRSLKMIPVTNPNQLSTKGGMAIPMYNPYSNMGWSRSLAKDEKAEVNFRSFGDYSFFVSIEDATRAKNPDSRGQFIGDVQTANFTNSGGIREVKSRRFTYQDLAAEPKVFGMIETYHRVASGVDEARKSDLVFTTNPRQANVNRFLTEGSFIAGPHYETRLKEISTVNGVIDTTADGRSAYYGASNNSFTGKTHLSFFEAPQDPLLSLGGFVNADLSATSYAPAFQFGNSRASAYLRRESVAKVVPASAGGGVESTFTREAMPVYDYSYLTNEALWDSFFFSGAAPTIQPGGSGGGPGAWENKTATTTRTVDAVIDGFVNNPGRDFLRNPRMVLHQGGKTTVDLRAALKRPEGCATIAAHLLVDGTFNVNSTSVEAWKAFLGGMRGKSFQVKNGAAPASSRTGFPRFRRPIGAENDNWQGFRSLSDTQIAELANNIVTEVRLRGPFLSLGEFVNRRVSDDALGLNGAIQSAIDRTSFNDASLFDTFDTSLYPADGRRNIVPAKTGVGIPGFLTQADVLQSIAPYLTVRSDTFIIRGYGEARDKNNNVTAVARCEMIVQRNPEFIDLADEAHKPVLQANLTNRIFGRKFDTVSFRYLNDSELGL